ncbi:MAG: cytochrome P450 [Pseudomonadota bacterium]
MPRDESIDASATPVSVTPPPEVLGILGAWRAARRNLIEFIPAPAFREPVLAGPPRLGGKKGPAWLMVMDPEINERVLKTEAANYPRSDITLRIFKPREGDSLFTAPDATWRWQHRAMAPIFQRRALEGIVPVMSAAAEATADRIAADVSARPDGIRDVYPDMVRATADVICDTALSGRESLDREALTRSVTGYIESVARISFLDVLGVPTWVPRPGRLLDREAKRMDVRMDAVIEARLARGPSDPPDLLDLLIAARDPGGDGESGGRGVDRVALRNNLLAFIIAGHETTALALTWALYCVAFDKDVEARAHEEAARVLDGRAAGAADLSALPYTRQIIDEALRLYPPAGLITKMAKVSDEIGGHRIEPGCNIMLPIWALHRHRLLWDEPDRFDPDRFTPDAKAARHRYAYLPFSAGPRICLGMQFALMEAQVILATLLARFRLALPDGFKPEPEMVFTLRPGTGMPLRLTPV